GLVTFAQFAAYPNSWCHFISTAASTAIIQQREILAEQTRRQHKPRAPGQVPFRLPKNNWTGSKVSNRHDAEGDRRPKKQCAPRPEHRGQDQEHRRSRCVVRTDAAIHDEWHG